MDTLEKVIAPTYYVRHPDDSYTEADPQPAPAVPDGWQLVPVEPTQKMLEAACSTSADVWLEDMYEIWRLMLAAAKENTNG